MAALKIAFLAWDAEQTDIYLQSLAIANNEQVKRYDRPRGRVELQDGTVIQGVHPMIIMDGRFYDQVIVADDRRLRLLRYRGDVLKELDNRCQFSKVPEEYRFQFFDLDEEAPKDGI